MASAKPAIVWFRHDLRLEDQPALHAAAERGGPVIPVFIWAPEEEGSWPPGAASRWWLHQSLESLEKQLRKRGLRLVLVRGKSLDALRAIVLATGADAVFWSRRFEPAAVERDALVELMLQKHRIHVKIFNSSLLFDPDKIHNREGGIFQVFTPFWTACLSRPAPAAPLPAPKRLKAPARWPGGLLLKQLALEPKIDWAGGIREAWTPGSVGAQKLFHDFIQEHLDSYHTIRDFPARDGASRLSPHLHFGEISIRQVWHAVLRRAGPGPKAFLKELGWREFAHHLLAHFPHTPDRPLRPEFGNFPWRPSLGLLEAWQMGRTGYPIVDAGIRQLWSTGWMHNRVRMIAASLLVKDLLIPWQEGARWFWDTLVDADLASNTLGWQWSAGCGADAAPYFRIFNPVEQGRKYDPDGAFVRKWVTELEKLPSTWIHHPWQAPASVLRAAGVRLGRDYPLPVVSHEAARIRALQAFQTLKGRRSA